MLRYYIARGTYGLFRLIVDCEIAKRPSVVVALALLSFFSIPEQVEAEEYLRPNIVLIVADDLGYGDLSCYGHPSVDTPQLDRMAREGQRWTDFYAAASICSPSRAALLTGRYPVRTGTHGGVFFEWSANGLGPEEVTIAEVLKAEGYATAMVGKWHLGHRPEYLPTRQGFDQYFGIPYSNDMRLDPSMPFSDAATFLEGMTLERAKTRGNKVDNWVPLMEGEAIVEYPCDQSTLTQRYTERCVSFIRSQREKPFFLYYAQTFPHVPLFVSEGVEGSSLRGSYGDVVEEMDDSIGQILEVLRSEGLAENTLVVFTSDNGPWLRERQEGGSAGLLRGGKGTTYEGGMRVPAIFWWPGAIAPDGIIRQLGCNLDLFDTFVSLADAELPNTELDSTDLSDVLLQKSLKSLRDTFFYYRSSEIFAVREGPWKAHFITQGAYGDGELRRNQEEWPQLFHLYEDPGEQYDVSPNNTDIVDRLKRLKAQQEARVSVAPRQYGTILEDQDLPDWVK